MIFLEVLVHEVKSTEDYLTKILFLGLSKEVVLYVILVHCLSTEQETDRGNTELIYVVDEVRVNVPLHIRIYSVDLNTAPRDDHFCPASFRTRENLTVYKSGDKSSKSKR